VPSGFPWTHATAPRREPAQTKPTRTNMSELLSAKRNTPMKRTKSSLLAFKLREFLDSKDDVAVEMPLPRVPEESRPLPMRARPSSKRERHEAHADAVWVDCFYYGFYLEKSKLPSFQASLRSQQQQQAQSGSSGPFMHMPPAAAAH